MGRPSARLQHTTTPTSTRIGGNPTTEPNFEWPHWQQRPLAFIAQISLAEIAAHTDLPIPHHGTLLFFYEPEIETYGLEATDQGAWKVIYQANPTIEQPAPDNLPWYGQYHPVYLAPQLETTYPDLPDSPHFTSDEYAAFLENHYQSGHYHRFGGHPQSIQTPVLTEIAEITGHKADWTLLLQVDSDTKANMIWGDIGSLYFCIPTSDLAQGHLDRCWMILQSY